MPFISYTALVALLGGAREPCTVQYSSAEVQYRAARVHYGAAGVLYTDKACI